MGRKVKKMKVAVQFGAGNIGRGFMGQLFWEAGYTTVFVEALKPLVAMLNKRKEYPLKLLDAHTKKEINLIINHLRAVAADDTEKVSEAVSQADIIGTAVGVKNLEAIAPPIAKGLRRRYEAQPGPVPFPLDIYLCENIQSAARMLKEAVMKDLEGHIRDWVEENIGFVGTIVARMVPSASGRFGIDDPLFVVADSFHKLSYEGKAVRAQPPPIEGIRPVDNFQAEVERKLFTYNLGHAALAYLGYLKGCSYVHEPFDDEYLIGIFNGALDETSQALLARYPDDLDSEAQRRVREDVDLRFGNPMIMDTVQRVARDPIRKLGPTDRLIGSARLCLSQGVFPGHIAVVCAAALCYDYEGDADALVLQEKIRKNGVKKTLEEICGVDPKSRLGKEIIESYEELQIFYY